MPEGQKPDYIAKANTRPDSDDPSFWVDVGAAWNYESNDKQGISVRLNATPLNWDGSFILVPR